MIREELEKQVLDLVNSDMEIVIFYTAEEIAQAVKSATDDDLIEYLQEVL